MAAGIAIGYLTANIQAAMLGRSAFENDWMLTNPQRKLTFICAVLIVPLAEELIYRGAILGPLLQRTSMIWATAITVTAATIIHNTWWMALPGQILLCTAYLIRGRSIAASTAAHVTGNAAIFASGLLIVFHMK